MSQYTHRATHRPVGAVSAEGMQMQACWAEVADAQRDREECAAEAAEAAFNRVLPDAVDAALCRVSTVAELLVDGKPATQKTLADCIDKAGCVRDGLAPEALICVILSGDRQQRDEAVMALRETLRQRLLDSTHDYDDSYGVAKIAHVLMARQEAYDRELADLRRWEDA